MKQIRKVFGIKMVMKSNVFNKNNVHQMVKLNTVIIKLANVFKNVQVNMFIQLLLVQKMKMFVVIHANIILIQMIMASNNV